MRCFLENQKEALIRLREILKIVKKSDFCELAYAHRHIGEILLEQDDDECVSEFKLYREYAVKLGDQAEIQRAWLCIGT